MSATKTKFIIDCDPGVDDMEAILMAMMSSKVELVAVTTVRGNGDVDQVLNNTRKILNHIGKKTIPVYKSQPINLIGNMLGSDSYFGNDAMAENNIPIVADYKEETLLSPMALIEITKKYPKEIELVAIGPLTNLALAYLLDNDFPNRLKALHVMGGDRAEQTTMNVTPYAEFNCWCDPAAFSIVFKYFGKVNNKLIKVIDFDFCRRHLIPTQKIMEYYGEDGNKDKHSSYGKLIEAMYSFMKDKIGQNGVITADPFTMYLFLNPDVKFTHKTVRLESVTLEGEKLGHTVFVDDPNGNICLVDSFDMEPFLKEFIASVY